MRWLLFLCLFSHHAFAQNLVPNPGFDDHADGKVLEWMQPHGIWYHYEVHWDQKEGKPYLNKVNGICLVHPGNTEYLQVKLLEKLKAGKSYKVQLNYKFMLKESPAFSQLGSIDLLFSAGERDISDRLMIRARPDIELLVTDTVSYETFKTLKTVYTARGDEAYLTIGKFYAPQEVHDEAELELASTYEGLKRKMNAALTRLDSIYLVKFRMVYTMKVPSKPEKAIRKMNEYMDMVNGEKRRSVDSLKSYYQDIFDTMPQDFRESYFNIRTYFDNISIVPLDVDLPEDEDNALPFIIGNTYTFRNVNFDLDKDALRPESFEELSNIAGIMNDYPQYHIRISGHTDDINTESYNQRLSENRAKACVEYLLKLGIDKSRLSFSGYGELRPLVPNSSDENRALNRRVDFVFTTH